MSSRPLKDENRIIGYVGPSDLHDGQVCSVHYDQETVTVCIESASGRAFSIEFTGVSEVKTISPAGMVLYALCQMQAPAPHRRFVFANWDEDDPATIEVVAQDLKVIG